MSGLVLVTGAAGGGPPGRRIAGLLLDRGVPVRAFAPTQDHRAEQLRQPGAEVAAGDPRGHHLAAEYGCSASRGSEPGNTSPSAGRVASLRLKPRKCHELETDLGDIAVRQTGQPR